MLYHFYDDDDDGYDDDHDDGDDDCYDDGDDDNDDVDSQMAIQLTIAIIK